MGGSKAGGLPHPFLSPFPPLPLSIPPKFSDKPVGGKVRSSEGEVPRLPPTNITLSKSIKTYRPKRHDNCKTERRNINMHRLRYQTSYTSIVSHKQKTMFHSFVSNAMSVRRAHPKGTATQNYIHVNSQPAATFHHSQPHSSDVVHINHRNGL